MTNQANDKHWRKEVNDTLLHGSFQSGVRVSEYAYLSEKAPNNLPGLTCVQFDRNNLVVFAPRAMLRFMKEANDR